MPTSVISPISGGNGYLFKQGTADWNTVWGDTVTATSVAKDTAGYVYTDKDSGNYRNQILKLPYSLSVIPKGSNIKSATITVPYPGGSAENNDSAYLVCFYNTPIANTSSLALADYQYTRSTEGANRVVLAASNAVFTLNAGALTYLRSALAASTAVKFAVTTSFYADNDPTSLRNIWSSSSTTSVLTVVYDLPVRGNPMFLSSGGLTLG